MEIPFVGGSYAGRSLVLNAQECTNLFPVVDPTAGKKVRALYGTSGCKAFADLAVENVVRGMYVFGDLIYVVCGSYVKSVNAAGVVTDLGEIATATGNVSMSDNGTQIIIVDGTAVGYLVEAGVLAVISDGDYPASSRVTFQDGYFIVTETDSGRIWISGLYDGDSWDALDYATAEARPDDVVAVESSSRELWVLGTKSTEVYYNSGNADFPFERLPGAFLELGIGAEDSVAKGDLALWWLTDKIEVVRSKGYSAQKVSTETVEYQWSLYSRVDDAKAFFYTDAGHKFYQITFPTENKTWVYDMSTGFWHERKSYQAAVAQPGRHRANCHVWSNYKNIVGDYENGKLYELDMSTFTDNGQGIRRVRAAQVISEERLNIFYHRFELEFEAGVGTVVGDGVNPKAVLDWSDDGAKTWSNELWADIGRIGEYQTRVKWNRLGRARSRVFRVVVSDPVKVVIVGAYIDAEAGEA